MATVARGDTIGGSQVGAQQSDERIFGSAADHTAPATHIDPQRLRAEAELAEALRALDASIPGSVVRGWIERRVSAARHALAVLDAPSISESDREADRPVLHVDVGEEYFAHSGKAQLPLSTCSSLCSPATAWLSRPMSLLDETSREVWPRSLDLGGSTASQISSPIRLAQKRMPEADLQVEPPRQRPRLSIDAPLDHV